MKDAYDYILTTKISYHGKCKWCSDLDIINIQGLCMGCASVQDNDDESDAELETHLKEEK